MTVSDGAGWYDPPSEMVRESRAAALAEIGAAGFQVVFGFHLQAAGLVELHADGEIAEDAWRGHVAAERAITGLRADEARVDETRAVRQEAHAHRRIGS